MLTAKHEGLQVQKITRSFPDIIARDNIAATYHALAQDNMSPALMVEIRGFLQELIELESGRFED